MKIIRTLAIQIMLIFGYLYFLSGFSSANPRPSGCDITARWYITGPTTEYINLQEITFDIRDLLDDYMITGLMNYSGDSTGNVNLKTLDANQDGFSDRDFFRYEENKAIWRPVGGQLIYEQNCNGTNLNVNCGYAIIGFQRKTNLSNGSVSIPVTSTGTYPDGTEFTQEFILEHQYSNCPISQPTSVSTLPHPIEKRLALVIGNSDYKDAPLPNPVNDAQTMRAALQRLGFEVMKYENITQREMKQAIDEFGQKLQYYDIGLFFYSGHGVQINGENYLIPLDANPRSEKEVEYECVNAGRILAEMETANNPTNIMILDACRENPFEKSWTRGFTSKGLAVMNAPTGSLIAYATAPGKVAYDAAGKNNSPYTSALLRYIETPNISIIEMFQQVRNLVIEDTNGKQTPWESTSLTGNFYFYQK